jgi:hypothetical protein
MLRILILAFAILITQGTLHTVMAQTATDRSEVAEAMSEEQKVQHLIEYIRTLENAKFIRDNSEFSPEKAAGHLSSKWQKHSGKVKTAEAFIMKLASESSSGTPYSIRFSDGTEKTTREVLLHKLRNLAIN